MVTGYQPYRIRRALKDLPARFVHNGKFEEGQVLSVQAGVAAAPESGDVMICLGDQPELSSNDQRKLIDWHHRAAAGQITVPFSDDGKELSKRGNPVMLAREAAHRVCTDDLKPGCRMLTDRHPERVNRFGTSIKGFLMDVDTLEAYVRLRGRTLEEGSAQQPTEVRMK